MQESPPVYALSFDTLRPIFEFAVNAAKTAEEATNTPLALSQVCSTWRQSTLRHAPLWANVLLGARGVKSLERATEFLSRSRARPIYVTFDMMGARKELPSLKERTGLLALHAHRLRALRVRGAATALPIHHFLRGLDFTFTELKDFEIVWGKPTTPLARRFPVTLGDRIPEAWLPYYLDLSPHDKLTNLTHFALKTHDRRLNIKMDQLLNVLASSPTLHSLELEGLYFEFEDAEFYDDEDQDDEDQETEKFILQLPHLQFLSLKQCLSGAFLPRINVPATTNVVLVANDPFILDYGDIHADPPNILYALPPYFRNLSFVGKFDTIDFEIQDASITLRASQPSGQYLLIEQVPDPGAIDNTTIEEMVPPSATSFASSDFGPVTTLRAINRLSESKRGVLRDIDPYELDSWLSPMSSIEKLEVFHFPLKFLRRFSGGKSQERLLVAAKDVTITLFPGECGDFDELKAWVKARADAQLPFEKLEIALDYSIPSAPPVDEKCVDSLRSSLAECVKDVVVKVFHPAQ